jgi:hypothetical protein
MPSPFPGIDPYLEHPALWPDVHNGLIAGMQEALAPQLRPRYYVAIEERTYVDESSELALVGRPDVAVVSNPSGPERTVASASTTTAAIEVTLPIPETARETYLEIRGVVEGDVVAVVELLSPANKRAGEGRRLYLDKRRRILGSLTHLVEVDLLRAGERMPFRGAPQGDGYTILVSPHWRRPAARVHAFSVRDPIPAFALPLRERDEQVAVDLGAVLASRYDRVGYDLRIDYAAEPQPPLAAEDAAWADALLRERGQRG